MFDREIRNAPSRIETIWRRESRGRTNVEASATTAAAIRLGRIVRQVEGGENGPEKQPGSESARNQICMFALPPQAALSGERLFHNRSRIDEYLNLAAGVGDQPASQFFQARLDDIVIVISLGIDLDRSAGAHLQDGKRIIVWSVIHSEHDDGACLSPHGLRGSAALGSRCQPRHIAVRTIGEEAFEPRFQFGHGVGFGNAERIESARARSLRERSFDRSGLFQKSRSA